jgi:hypothetical protein
MNQSASEHVSFDQLLRTDQSADSDQPPPKGTFARALWDAGERHRSMRVAGWGHRGRDGRPLK